MMNDKYPTFRNETPLKSSVLMNIKLKPSSSLYEIGCIIRLDARGSLFLP